MKLPTSANGCSHACGRLHAGHGRGSSSALDERCQGHRACPCAAGHIVASSAQLPHDPSVPLVIPEVNADHLSHIARIDASTAGRRHRHHPNCSTMCCRWSWRPRRPAFARVVRRRRHGRRVSGRRSHPRQRDPFIPAGKDGERDAEDPRRYRREAVVPHAVTVSAQTTRVPVVTGIPRPVPTTLCAAPADARGARAFAPGRRS